MGIARSARSEFEEVLEILRRKRVDLVFVVNNRLKALLGELTLEDLLLNGSSRKETIREAPLLLAISPATSSSLLVYCWIPIRIEQDETIASNQVETTVMLNRNRGLADKAQVSHVY